ncbi:MAG: LptF/LptG family permease [Nitrospiraceae bacterium]|nr:MAG: LptF/LptG family permease [Nitrospiraceae bacterium]
MRIISGYFLKEFCKFFFICFFGMVAIFVVAEFFDKADEFYEQKAPALLVLEYLLLHAPKSFIFASPIASLLSILFTIGMASKWKETVAIRAAGGSIKRLFSTFLLIGILISMLVLFLNETLVPLAASRASWVRYTKILKKSTRITYREGILWAKGLDGSLIRIRDFVEDEKKILKVSIFKLSPFFQLTQRIEADEGEWVNGTWNLKNVTVFDFAIAEVKSFKEYDFDALEEPKIFIEEMKKPAEMNFMELYTYYKRLEKAGFKNNRYVVELYGKLAHPMVNFVMIVFGIALALNSRFGGGIRAAGLGLIVIVSYWMILSMSMSLGNTGTLPPAFAPWIGPAIFCFAGSYLYVKIKE